ncbi:hypothetical protein I3842_10G149700 [Carya illinoinensis]|uniref:Putative plant transposon protein domain-containing protein n=1 Tax=Carya illinoinensis TaxID=32201 RepID=A0A922DZG8_CARIL|nr:hypothetical protein I3842_10G149700 [Carya illinoinensis]
MSRRVRPRQNPPAPAQAQFHSARAQELYSQNFSHRTPIVEREVTLGELTETIIPRIFESRQWQALTTGHPTPSVELVREFYSNIHDISVDDSFEVSLRNVVFRVTPGMIATLLNAPRELYPEFPYSRTSPPSPQVIATCLCGRPSSWEGTTPISTARFTPDHLILSRIVLTNLDPTGHNSDVGLDRARLLYALINGVSIDLGSLLCRVIVEAYRSSKTRTGLPLPCLITRIALSQSVAFHPQEPRIALKAPIGRRTVQLSRAHTTPQPIRVEHPPASSSQPSSSRPSSSQPSTSAPSSSQPSSSAPGSSEPGLQQVLEYLARLDARFDRLEVKVDNLQQLVTQRFNDIERQLNEDDEDVDGDD